MSDKKKSEPDARFGYDLVGEDGRRIHRGVSYTYAVEERGRISSATQEELEIVPSEGPAPSVATPAPAEPEGETAAKPA